MHNSSLIPLSLYIHLPWCVRKCPYCDFNSHSLRETIPEQKYVSCLLQDLEQDLDDVQNRSLVSIFFGGGTPSLFSAEAIAKIIRDIKEKIPFAPNIEITLEANPGTAEQQKFIGFKQAGVNRLSIGCQSFQNDKLNTLGRIHDPFNAMQAAEMAKMAGFETYNLDLMFGLPEQTIEDAIFDLTTAINLAPTHISWYQLTLEPNTLFHHNPPPLPDSEIIWTLQEQGQHLLNQQGFNQYEVSAYAKQGHQCRHNLNYWQFGDYLGIGAGAHSKITDLTTGIIKRSCKIKHPKSYLTAQSNFVAESNVINSLNLPFEFMINALRLCSKIPKSLFETRTGLSWSVLDNPVGKALSAGFVKIEKDFISLTPHGYNFLNDVTALFLV